MKLSPVQSHPASPRTFGRPADANATGSDRISAAQPLDVRPVTLSSESSRPMSSAA